MDCCPPGSSVNGILQARILEWVVISFSRGSFQPRDWRCVSCIGKRIPYHWATREAWYLTHKWALYLSGAMHRWSRSSQLETQCGASFCKALERMEWRFLICSSLNFTHPPASSSEAGCCERAAELVSLVPGGTLIPSCQHIPRPLSELG